MDNTYTDIYVKTEKSLYKVHESIINSKFLLQTTVKSVILIKKKKNCKVCNVTILITFLLYIFVFRRFCDVYVIIISHDLRHHRCSLSPNNNL